MWDNPGSEAQGLAVVRLRLCRTAKGRQCKAEIVVRLTEPGADCDGMAKSNHGLVESTEISEH